MADSRSLSPKTSTSQRVRNSRILRRTNTNLPILGGAQSIFLFSPLPKARGTKRHLKRGAISSKTKFILHIIFQDICNFDSKYKKFCSPMEWEIDFLKNGCFFRKLAKQGNDNRFFKIPE